MQRVTKPRISSGCSSVVEDLPSIRRCPELNPQPHTQKGKKERKGKMKG